MTLRYLWSMDTCYDRVGCAQLFLGSTLERRYNLTQKLVFDKSDTSAWVEGLRPHRTLKCNERRCRSLEQEAHTEVAPSTGPWQALYASKAPPPPPPPIGIACLVTVSASGAIYFIAVSNIVRPPASSWVLYMVARRRRKVHDVRR